MSPAFTDVDDAFTVIEPAVLDADGLGLGLAAAEAKVPAAPAVSRAADSAPAARVRTQRLRKVVFTFCTPVLADSPR
ncbi:hypothetical protein GCM10010326_59970 [Streptomyces xanthochromogenes]|uniref:Uncharacterized protein n=1 Tax=Streptomyces xanthochromogenes TaxID=67384 RepID=A0ABQ3AL70_9ACTN|nr:hypothetical protein GCM10010326_59970 [Streptomyces xanthochromogenes]